jgi:hypothetical protein
VPWPGFLNLTIDIPLRSPASTFRLPADLSQPSTGNYCHTASPIKRIRRKSGCVDNNNVFPGEVCNVTEFDIGEFFIRGEAREVEGEFQAVIVMRAKPPLKTVTYHQVEKDRWFKTPDVAAIAAQESARELKAAVDAGALKA